MLLSTFWGCFIFAATNACLLYASHLLVRKFFSPAPPACRLIACGILYYAFIILIFQALSPFHAISKTWITVSCILLAAIVHIIWGDQRNFNAEIEPVTIWLKEGLNSKWAVLIVVCGFVVSLSFSRALLMPPLVYDCLTYHLTFAAMWIKQGTLFLFKAPDQIADCAYFPINGELFAAWLLLPFHTDLVVNLMNFPVTLLGGIACYAIGRELGLSRKEASFAPAIVCFAPMIYSQITTALVDNASLTFYAASVLFILRYIRRGCLYDGLMALTAAGILVGIKHSGIPMMGLVLIAFIIKLLPRLRTFGFFKSSGLILGCLLLMCSLGGRQYVLNTVEAHNPLYPFSVEVLGKELLQGSEQWEQVREWISQYETEKGFNKFSLWERIYRRSLYVAVTFGPKFLTFLVLALISVFIRPHHVSKTEWYFLAVAWIIPLALAYTGTSANCARKGPWIESSSRFFSPYIALFTIQSLVLVKKFRHYSKGIDFFFVVLIAWDLLYINKTHLWEVEVSYPLIVLILFILLLSVNLVSEGVKKIGTKKESSRRSKIFSRFGTPGCSRWPVITICFISLAAGIYLLQCYRDATRYEYFNNHSDHQSFIPLSKNLVQAWEYLDQPGENKTIALTMERNTPLGRWLFYPLLGKRLQNDIVYISAKHKWEVPAWLDRGLLRGSDFSIWLFNLRKEGVNYILVNEPWPIELSWMQNNRDKFQMVFVNEYCRIYKLASLERP